MSMSPTIVCNNILVRSFSDGGAPVTPMKLQKLLYFVACEYQKRTHTPLFSELFEVWKYGPVLRSVYDEFKSFGKDSITSYAKDAQGLSYIIDESTTPHLAAALNRIWTRFSGMDAIALSNITHQEGSGWSAAYDRHEMTITPQQMEEDCTYASYFSPA